MSAIPTVLDAFVAALRTSTDLVGVQVIDGEPFTDLEGDVVIVGFSPDRLAVTQTETGADLAGGDLETFDVVNVASSWSGDPELKPRRDRAFTLLAAVRAVLRHDQTLAGTCMWAGLTVSALAQGQTRKDGAWTGAQATVEFVVTVRVFPDA